MTVTHLLASGPGWRVRDIICTAGPGDRAFEEQHAYCCIAAVTSGSFRYRSAQGTALLAPGAVLLGNHGSCFECGHEHATGDRCLAIQFEPAYLETILAGVPGARHLGFSRPHLPPSAALAALMADMVTSGGDSAAYEEHAIRLAGAVATTLAEARPPSATPTTRDVRRITKALRRIEAHSEEPLTVSQLAREAAMSPYHFLRTFKALVGVTPHQFLLRTRLHHAALLLRRSELGVAQIGDLSTFNHRFRRVMGASPSAYRLGTGARRPV